jgi:uncharacterized membrane protein YgdD (TMEM256/DUF423 family)
MHKSFLRIACLLGALSVALGAFGAHKLKEMISEDAVRVFETAVRYQFYHVFALLAAGILYQYFPSKFMRCAGICFILGIVFFSGSLYLLTYIKGAVIPGYDWIGAITPLGGLFFILGWVSMFLGINPRK